VKKEGAKRIWKSRKRKRQRKRERERGREQRTEKGDERMGASVAR